MGASATCHIFFEFKISVVFSEPLGEENIGKLLNEKDMPYCMSTPCDNLFIVNSKMQCFLPFCLTSVLDFKEENLKSKQSNAMVSVSADLMGSVLLLFFCKAALKAYFLH